MHLLADAHIPWLPFLLGDSETGGQLRLSRYETPQQLHEQLSGAAADALLIRTTAKINRQSFPEFPPGLKAIATATAGTDHVDVEWLREHEIQFFHSPGCNARSVGEYVATAMLNFCKGQWKTLRQKKVGIVGFGNTGRQVAALLDKLGVDYISYDPPRQALMAASGKEHDACQSSEAAALSGCDIITLHVPLVFDGPHPTHHLLSRLGVLHEESRFDLLINASRGGVLNEKTAGGLRKNGRLSRLVLDVWENEPQLRLASLEAADLATPHIAGYSLQAKFEASRMVCRQLGRALGFSWREDTPEWGIDAYINAEKGVYSAVCEQHPAFELDALLRREPTPQAFAHLRNRHPLRMEFSSLRLQQRPADPGDEALAKALGFGLPA